MFWECYWNDDICRIFTFDQTLLILLSKDDFPYIRRGIFTKFVFFFQEQLMGSFSWHFRFFFARYVAFYCKTRAHITQEGPVPDLKLIITLPELAKKKFVGQNQNIFRPWQDSNLQSPDPKSDALSVRPHGLGCVLVAFQKLPNFVLQTMLQHALMLNTSYEWKRYSLRFHIFP